MQIHIWLRTLFSLFINTLIAEPKYIPNFISRDLALEFYDGIISPHFSFADAVYDGSMKAEKYSVQIAQNKALSAALNIDNHYPTKSLLLNRIVKTRLCPWKRCCIETYKLVHDVQPSNVCCLFKPVSIFTIPQWHEVLSTGNSDSICNSDSIFRQKSTK